MQELVPSPCRDHVVYCKGIAERSGPPLRRRLVRWAKLSRRTPAFLGPDQEQHLEFIDAAAAHMSAYDDNPRAQARARQGDILVVVELQTTENSKNPIFQVAPVFAYLY